MSKTVKRKITVELPKPRDLSKNRLSVFQRLGTKKHKTDSVPSTDDVIQTQATVPPSAVPKIIDKPEAVALEDADPDLLEKKRAELKKELELQLKMETTRKTTKDVIRKRKKVQSSSSSSSSSSDSSTSDSSSSSSSKESKRKIKKIKTKRRNSSSSSDEPRSKKTKIKRVCHKKVDPNKPHKLTHIKKVMAVGGKPRKRSQSPTARKRVPVSPSRLPHKAHLKIKPGLESISASKHHRLKEIPGRSEKDRDIHHQRERERDRERLRPRDKERGRSRTPKFHGKSRSPKLSSRSRDLGHKTSPRRVATPTKSRLSGGSIRRDRTPDRSMSSTRKDIKRHGNSRDRERERREKERQDHEAAREKERQEILARCQERQRERERLAREKARRERDRDDDRGKSDRLLPRPAERAMALAAARDRSRDKSLERDRPRSHSHGQMVRERMDREKDVIPYDRPYERDDPRYDHIDRRYEKDDRGLLDERDRYMVMRRRDDSRGRSPYAMRDKRLERDDIEREMYMAGDQRYDDHLRDDHREPIDYPTRGYVDDRHRMDREREWIRENELVHEQERRMMYDHPQERMPVRDWDRNEMQPGHAGPIQDNYVDSREWGGMGDRQWEAGGAGGGGGGGGGGVGVGGGWPQETEEVENWDNVEEKDWQEYHRVPDKMRHDTGGPIAPGGAGGNVGIGGGGGGVGGLGGGLGGGGGTGNRRWNSWRGRRGNLHHNSGGPGGSNDYRRHNIHSQPGEGYQNRGDMSYNRRLPPQQPPLLPKPELHTAHPLIPAAVGNEISHNQPALQRHLPPAPQNLPKPAEVATPSPAKSIQSESMISSVPAATTPAAAASAPIAPLVPTAASVPAAAPAPAVVPAATATPEEKSTDAKKEEPLDETEEQIPDDLSEISGDDADDILNRQEDETPIDMLSSQPLPTTPLTSSTFSQEKQNTNFSTIQSSDGSNNDAYGLGQYFRPDYEPELQEKAQLAEETEASAVKVETPEETTVTSAPTPPVNSTPTAEPGSVQPQAPIVSKTDSQESSKDIPDEMDLDFEEISDGELEEEARIRGLGDALGVDWASLVEESKAIAQEKSITSNSKTTGKQRWQPHRILLDVGVSLKMGGTEFATKILSEAYAKLQEEEQQQQQQQQQQQHQIQETHVKIKIEPKDEEEEYENVESKPGSMEESMETESPIHLTKIKVESDSNQNESYHPVACVQVASRREMEKRKQLIFGATGPYSRALCARRDLQMRRQLYGLPGNGDSSLYNRKSENKTKTQSPYAKLALELFNKAVGEVR